MEWISVKERLPKPEEQVLISIGIANCITTAMYIPHAHMIDDEDFTGFSFYHEETEKYYWPEGWYEYQWTNEEYIWSQFSDSEKITHWKKLPKPPKTK